MQGILVFLDFTLNPIIINMLFGLLIAGVLTIVIGGLLLYFSSKKPYIVLSIALVIVIFTFILYFCLFCLAAELIVTHDLFIDKATPDILVARVSAITFNGILLVCILQAINDALIKKTENKKIGKTLSGVGSILVALGVVFYLLNNVVPSIYDTITKFPSLAIGIVAVVLGNVLGFLFAGSGKQNQQE